MTFDPAFLDLFTQTVTLRRATGTTDGYGSGSETFGPDEEIQARIVDSPVQVRTLDGEVTVARTTVWLAGVFGVQVTDQVELPDGRTPKILMVEQFPDEDGPHHEKVRLG